MTKRTPRVIDATAKQITAAPEGDEFFAGDENVARFLTERAEGVSDAIVKVYKAAGPSKPGTRVVTRDAYLYECPPEEFSEELLQDSYGEGTYRIKLYGTSAEGAYGLLYNRKLEIGPKPRFRAASAARPEGSSLGAITLNVPQTGGEGDALVRAVTAAMKPILETMAGMVNGGGNRKAMLEEFALIAQIVRGNAQAAPDPVSMMRTFAEISREFSPGDADANPFARLIDKFAPVFMDAYMKGKELNANALPGAASATGAQPQPQPGAVALASQALAQAHAAPQPQPNPEDDPVLKLKIGLQFLVMQAEAQNEAETYADVVLDNVPEESIRGLLAMPDPLAHLGTFEPKVLAHREWFGLLLEAVKEELAAPDGDGAAGDGKAE